MAGFEELPELVRQARLETKIRRDRTTHTRLRSHRRDSTQEVWVKQKTIGQGGYGQVWVERKSNSTRATPELRAVKRILTTTQRRDYVRELEALAKFSSNKSKVRSSYM